MVGKRARRMSFLLDVVTFGIDRCPRVPYAALAQAFSLIEATTKRLEKTALLTALFLLVIRRTGKGDTQSLLQTVYLCINRVRAWSSFHWTVD